MPLCTLLLFSALLLLSFSLSFSLRAFSRTFNRKAGSSHADRLSMSTETFSELGGKIIVTGIGGYEEDEFALNLLNEQTIWSTVLLATSDSTSARKRFLSRTARYSGLLNVLDFADVDLSVVAAGSGNENFFSGANAWVAFNLTRESIVPLSSAALAAGVKRVVITTPLAPSDINTTVIPEFDEVKDKYEAAGISFTGIRHGTIIDGNEDNAYEIVNSSIPCLEDTVERGVLARVVAELLRLDKSSNSVCGVSSGSAFAAAYLNVLRSSGLTRAQEVGKIFSGGLQKVAQMTVRDYEEQNRLAEERKIKAEKRKQEEDEENLREKELALKQLPSGGESKGSSSSSDLELIPNDGDEYDAVPDISEKENIDKRVEEILLSVWREYDARMFTKSTSKAEFFDINRPKAIELAERELREQREKEKETLEEEQAKRALVDRLVETNRQQYAKLLSIERRELQNQKQISDTWVKFIYVLIEVTLDKCRSSGILFHNEDEYSQTLLLRKVANELRVASSLPNYDVIYDPLDASVIVERLISSTGLREHSILGVKFDVSFEDTDQVAALLKSKHGQLLKNVPALRGASQIIELAIETLQKELPPAPPSVNQLRQTESSTKQAAVSASRIDALRNRGKPKTGEDDGVGRM